MIRIMRMIRMMRKTWTMRMVWMMRMMTTPHAPAQSAHGPSAARPCPEIQARFQPS